MKLEKNPLYDSLKEQFSNHRLNSLKNEVVKKINMIANKNNYDNSDPYTDYFDVGYYVTITDCCKSIQVIS